jgi:hypothetical protein
LQAAVASSGSMQPRRLDPVMHISAPLFLSLSLLLPSVCAGLVHAQDDSKKPATPQAPEPKRPEHEALQSLAGTWDVTMRSEALPGVPGMEQAGESKGSERAELVNNGLWLKSTITGTRAGKPCEGFWLAGYDPFQKEYVGVCVGSDEKEPGIATMKGTYDAAKKTWTWAGKLPHGDLRSVAVIDGPDSITETCYMTVGGKELKCMEITRKRSTASGTAVADASFRAQIPAEVSALRQDIGTWDATVRCTMAPGKTATEDKGSETVTAICGGRWLWSDFSGQSQGIPFEGHCLYGYDANEKKLVSIWVDSMSPVWCKTSGSASGKPELKLEGTCVDANGRVLHIKQTLNRADDTMRAMHMEAEGPDGTSTMDITYRRRAKN